MKKFIPFILAVSLFAGCLGRRTPDSAADATVADVRIPEANTKSDPAGEGSDAGDWIYRNGGRKRWGPFVERDTTFLFVEEYPIGSDTNHYRVFIRRAPQPADNMNFTVLSPQNERNWNEFTSILRGIKKSHPEPLPRHAALKELPRSWTPVRSFGGRYYVDGFAPYPVWISDRSSRAHLPHALSSPDIGRIFGYRPGGDTHRGYRTQDSRICFLLRKQ